MVIFFPPASNEGGLTIVPASISKALVLRLIQREVPEIIPVNRFSEKALWVNKKKSKWNYIIQNHCLIVVSHRAKQYTSHEEICTFMEPFAGQYLILWLACSFHRPWQCLLVWF